MESHHHYPEPRVLSYEPGVGSEVRVFGECRLESPVQGPPPPSREGTVSSPDTPEYPHPHLPDRKVFGYGPGRRGTVLCLFEGLSPTVGGNLFFR